MSAIIFLMSSHSFEPSGCIFFALISSVSCVSFDSSPAISVSVTSMLAFCSSRVVFFFFAFISFIFSSI